MREQLQAKGVAVCATEYGKQLGKGGFECGETGSAKPIVSQVGASSATSAKYWATS